MNKAPNDDGIKQHPIQIISIGVIELHIRAYLKPEEHIAPSIASAKIEIGVLEYDSELKRVSVRLKCSIGKQLEDNEKSSEENPYYMNVVLRGDFSVNEDEFDIKHINRWAKENSIFILFPYLREHVYSITQRCGFKPVVLPLILVPTNDTPSHKKP